MCVLLVFIDDATGQLVGMHFCEAESTFEYMEVTKRYLLEYVASRWRSTATSTRCSA